MAAGRGADAGLAAALVAPVGTVAGARMIRAGLQGFANKKVLLLQGPVGPFFWRLAKDLRSIGAQVHKINFNGGDWLFYPRGAVHYRGSLQQWPEWFADYLQTHQIEVVLLFGDCRPLHERAREIAHERGLEVGVFEEGYVRPDFITLERYGVNGYSRIPRDPQFYRQLQLPQKQGYQRVGNTYWYCVLWVVLYYLMAHLLKPVFRRYRHHRPLTLRELRPQMLGVWRKWNYRWRERGVAEHLLSERAHQYFLMPLQVHNDSQIHVHSRYDSVRRFIVEGIRSFAAHAPADTLLVIKHHPLDRAYHDYSLLISRFAERKGVAGRVLYIHDQHLPSLLEQARGVIVVNSTVGLSALYHHKPVKACGNAIYDLPGLTWQGALDDFWGDAANFTMDRDLFQNYRQYLIAVTQINGSFYKRLPVPDSVTGLVWRTSVARVPPST